MDEKEIINKIARTTGTPTVLVERIVESYVTEVWQAQQAERRAATQGQPSTPAETSQQK